MADEMDGKIRQISDMLNSQEAQEGIRQLFNSINRTSEPNVETDDEDYEKKQNLMVSPGNCHCVILIGLGYARFAIQGW